MQGLQQKIMIYTEGKFQSWFRKISIDNFGFSNSCQSRIDNDVLKYMNLNGYQTEFPENSKNTSGYSKM